MPDNFNAKSFVERHPYVVLKANGEFDARFTKLECAQAHAEFIHGYVADLDGQHEAVLG